MILVSDLELLLSRHQFFCPKNGDYLNGQRRCGTFFTMECYLAIKRSKAGLFVVLWVDLDI